MLFSFRITGGKAGRWCGRECVTLETDWWTVGDHYIVLSLCLSFPTKRGNCRHQAERFLLVAKMYLKSHFRMCGSLLQKMYSLFLHVKRSKLLRNLILLFFSFFFFFMAMCMVSVHVCVHVCRCIRGTCMSRSQLLHFLEALAELRTHPFWLV